ncbi:MAG: CYTH domain-containing protein [Polyangiaceae bacterium]|nr:CYTH domain-containing protein [Polyangiaceae bacterium]
MGTEIERKFLVVGDAWREGASGVVYRQGYLCTTPDRTVRVRVGGAKGYLTVKGSRKGVSRLEFEFEVPLADATVMLDELCIRPLIEKTRFRIEYEGLVWEVDEFAGANAGLVIAEVELLREDQEVKLPPWVGREVSTDDRYSNSNLAERPFSAWRTGSD